MKLIVQIPCYNEEETLAGTVAEIPRSLEGIDQVEILVIDDGSTDRTGAVAHEMGVDHVVRHRKNCGLGRAFRTGIDACLALGADIIVNTDGDNQYPGNAIPRLIAPLVAGTADVVIGDRQPWRVGHFSLRKRVLQVAGSLAIARICGMQIPDAVCGFRAYSRRAALQINVVSTFSYTIETILQASQSDLAVASVPVATNRTTRQSRLFRSIPEFLARSAAILVRTYTMYRPLRIFLCLSALLLFVGVVPIVRFLYLYFICGQGSGHVQSLVLGGTAVMMGVLMAVAGIIADLIAFNRQLLEIALQKLRRLESDEEAGDRAASYPAGISPGVSDATAVPGKNCPRDDLYVNG